jgi:GR25 family glycosyltransferase involved in LPS biosynthesis
MSVPVYVINLDTSIRRWQRLWGVLQRHDGLSVTRVSAIDGRHLTQADLLSVGTSLRTTLELTSKSQPRCRHWMIDAPGAIGATLSHIKVWQAMVTENHPFAVVLEDDANVLVDHVGERLHNLTRSNLHGFDVLLLTAPFTSSSHVCKIKGDFMGMHGYCISQRAAGVLFGRAYPIEQHIDHYVSSLARLGLLSVGTVSLALVGTTGDTSTIHHGLMHTDLICVSGKTCALVGVLALSVITSIVWIVHRRRQKE